MKQIVQSLCIPGSTRDLLKLVQQGFQGSRMHSSYGALLAGIPAQLLAEHAHRSDLGKIMVFRTDPVYRDKIIGRAFFFQALRKIDRGDDLEDEIQRTGKQNRLM